MSQQHKICKTFKGNGKRNHSGLSVRSPTFLKVHEHLLMLYVVARFYFTTMFLIQQHNEFKHFRASQAGRPHEDNWSL